MQVLWQKKDVQAVFSHCLLKLGSLQPFFPDLYFLNHLVNAVVSGLSFFLLTLSIHICSIPFKEKLGGL